MYANQTKSGASPREGSRDLDESPGWRGSGSHYSLPFPAEPTRAQTCRSIPKLKKEARGEKREERLGFRGAGFFPFAILLGLRKPKGDVCLLVLKPADLMHFARPHLKSSCIFPAIALPFSSLLI